jgi:hypothetical protein
MVGYEWFNELFNSPEFIDKCEWLFRSWDPSALDHLQKINGLLVQQALCAMSEGETCSDDHVVVEMLLGLEEQVCDVIAVAFGNRVLNRPEQDADIARAFHIVNLIPKKCGHLTINDFRPIVVLPTMRKLYRRVLLLLTEDKLHQLKSAQLACRKGFEVQEVLRIVGALPRKPTIGGMMFL